MRNWYKMCCLKGGSVSRDEDSAYIESNDSIDDLSMISVTYGLESFNKNAMLLFCQVTSSEGSRNRDLTMSEVTQLQDTFKKYRFDVETHVDLTSSEIEKKCDEFFARDFTDYGAVAVVVLAPTGKTNALAASDQMFDEIVIFKHFTTKMPITLKDKPKIYITEANRQFSQAEGQESPDEGIDVNGTGSCSKPVVEDECSEDILGFHIPSVIEGAARSPLKIFCDRMKAAEDSGNLIGIVIGSVDEIEEAFPDLQEQLVLTCTFRKRFTLPVSAGLE